MGRPFESDAIKDEFAAARAPAARVESGYISAGIALVAPLGANMRLRCAVARTVGGFPKCEPGRISMTLVDVGLPGGGGWVDTTTFVQR